MSIIVKQKTKFVQKKQSDRPIQVFKIGEGDKKGVKSSKSVNKVKSKSVKHTSITFVETEGEDMD